MLKGALFGIGVGAAASAIWAVSLFGYAFITSLRPVGWLIVCAVIAFLLWNL